MSLSILALVTRDPNGGNCHRYRVRCGECGLEYVTNGNLFRVARRRSCQTCINRENARNRRKRS